jgi:hypothetical protein
MSGEEMTEDGTTGGTPGGMTGGSRRRPIATPAQRPSTAASAPGNALASASFRAALTAQDVRRLTLFKWRYSLESAGFTSRQAGHLLFLKWLHARRRVVG